MPDLIIPSDLKRGDLIRGMLKDLPATGTLRVDLAGNPEWVAATVLDYGARAGFTSFEFVSLGDGVLVDSDRERIKKRADRLGVAIEIHEGSSLPNVDAEGTGRRGGVGGSLADELERLHEMRERGILTDAEFEAAKRSVVSNAASPPSRVASSATPPKQQIPKTRGETRRAIVGLAVGVAVVYLLGQCAASVSEFADTTPARSAFTPATRAVSMVNVVYEVTGTARNASLTITNQEGGTEQFESVAVPWRKTLRVEAGEFVYVSAQNNGEFGTVGCRISANGATVESATSSGAYVIASCSGSAAP